MKFFALTDSSEYDQNRLAEAYKAARAFGVLRVGSDCLFFRARLKTWFIPYKDIHRCFRRVMLVPAKLCCGRGDFEIQNLVIQGDKGELAQIQLPGERAAKAVMEELKQRMPWADFSAPEKKADPA